MTLLAKQSGKICITWCGKENCECKNRNVEIDPVLKLQFDYEQVCQNYILEFCKKQEIDFDFWVQDLPGTVAFFGDYSFCFTDIVLDINSKQPKGTIFVWFEFSLENHHRAISYYNYTKL